MTRSDDWYLECALRETLSRRAASPDLATAVLARRDAALQAASSEPHTSPDDLWAGDPLAGDSLAGDACAAERFAPTTMARSRFVYLAAAVLLGVGVVSAVMFARPERAAQRQAQDPIPSKPSAIVLADYQDFARRIPSLEKVHTTALLDGNGVALPPHTVTTGAKSRGFDQSLTHTKPGDRAASDIPVAARVALVFRTGIVRARLVSRSGADTALVIPSKAGPITLRDAVAKQVRELLDSASRTAPCNLKTIRATSATEFVAALGSNRTIEIPAGTVIKLPEAEFEPTPAVHYSTDGEGADTWDEMRQYVTANLKPGNPDKGSLVIRGLENLRIVAVGGQAEMESDFFESRLLEFRNCSGIALDNFTIGHAKDGKMKRTCAGGVLAFHTCRDISLHRMDLYGCGTEGILAHKVERLHADTLRIHHCAYGFIFAETSRDWTIRNGMFEETHTWMDNGAIGLVDAKNFRFEHCTIRGLQGAPNLPIMQAVTSEGVRFEGGIENITGLNGKTPGFEVSLPAAANPAAATPAAATPAAAEASAGKRR
ncbi:MAG: hypothetical protein AB8H80_00700 [Planctomycetota bacterium]